jgi:hypothetical protein
VAPLEFAQVGGDYCGAVEVNGEAGFGADRRCELFANGGDAWAVVQLREIRFWGLWLDRI